MQLQKLPDAPRDDHEASVWIRAAAGVVESNATAYHELARCLEENRAKGVIR